MQLELKAGKVHIDRQNHPLSARNGIEPNPGIPMVTFFVSPASGAPEITVEMPTTDAVRFASALLDTVSLSEEHWRGKFCAF